MRATWCSRGHQHVLDASGCGQPALVNASGEFIGARCPEVGMKSHRQVRDGCRVPAEPLMHDIAVYQPGDAVVSPVDAVPMEICRGVKAKLDPIGRASVAVSHRRAVVAWIEIHVDQHLPGGDSRELDIDLLPWVAAVKKESGDQTRAARRPDLCLESAVSEGTLRREGCGPIGPRSTID